MAKVWTPALAIMVFLAVVGMNVRAEDPPAAKGGPPPKGAPFGGPQFCPPIEVPPPSATPFIGPPELLNAFQEYDCPPVRPVCYFGIGTLALSRGSLGNGVIAVRDPGINIPGIPSNVDTGNLPPASAPPAVRFNAVPKQYQFGVQGTVGWQYGAHAIEFSGFYIPRQTAAGTVTLPGSLDAGFANSPPPLGFLGDNFLWLQADQIRVQLQNQIANAELNYRWQQCRWLEWILGVRYLDLREQLGITTDDDGIVAQPHDILRVATVQAITHSRIAGAQFGFQTQHYLVPPVAVGLTNKYMVGNNFYSVSNSLFRGDGFQGPSASRSGSQIGGLIELDAYVMLWLNSHIRLRAGYMALWLLNVPEVQRQINFNPAIPGTMSNNGNIFYHGPRFEVQIAF